MAPLKLTQPNCCHFCVTSFGHLITKLWSSLQIGDTHSDSCSIKCGVPQGSILGPLLFLIYVNDMRAAVSCKLLLYADDSALLTSGKDVSEIEGVLSRELESLSEWLEENRLSFRVGFLPEEMTFFRTGGRKWKKLISSISSAEDLEESGRFGRKWNKWNITNIKNKIHVL